MYKSKLPPQPSSMSLARMRVWKGENWDFVNKWLAIILNSVCYVQKFSTQNISIASLHFQGSLIEFPAQNYLNELCKRQQMHLEDILLFAACYGGPVSSTLRTSMRIHNRSEWRNILTALTTDAASSKSAADREVHNIQETVSTGDRKAMCTSGKCLLLPSFVAFRVICTTPLSSPSAKSNRKHRGLVKFFFKSVFFFSKFVIKLMKKSRCLFICLWCTYCAVSRQPLQSPPTRPFYYVTAHISHTVLLLKSQKTFLITQFGIFSASWTINIIPSNCGTLTLLQDTS